MPTGLLHDVLYAIFDEVKAEIEAVSTYRTTLPSTYLVQAVIRFGEL